LERFGFRNQERDEVAKGDHEDYPIVFLGFHRGANAVIEKIAEADPELLKKILVVDFNLEVLNHLRSKNIKGVFGDIGSMDTLHHAHVERAKMILSTIPDMLLKGTNNVEIVKTCRAVTNSAHIVATADSVLQIDTLKAAGANEVILPYLLIGDKVSRLVLDTFARGKEKKDDVQYT
jgi:voltage-gated potassium channel Kch